MLDDIVALATKANVQVLFDFNSLEFRDHKGQWDPAGNATATLQYLESKYAGQIDFAWSTGNEPDLWPGTHYSGEELAAGARAGRAGGGAVQAALGARASCAPAAHNPHARDTHAPPTAPPTPTDANKVAATVAGYSLGKATYGPSYAGFSKDAEAFMRAAGPGVTGLSECISPLRRSLCGGVSALAAHGCEAGW